MGESVPLPHLAFPDHEHGPPALPQKAFVSAIAIAIRLQFRLPKVETRLWKPAVWTTGMPMPKTAVDEDHFSSSRKNEIRATGKFSPMEPVTVTGPMHQATNDKLRLRVLRPNPAHSLATLLR